MKLFELKQVTETAGDCTARYDVILKKSGIKVKEFVDYIVKEMTEEWGDIEISTKKGKDALWDCYAESIAEYSKGKLIRRSSEFNQYSEMIILEAYACGGWSMMEYILVLDMPIKKNETTKTYEQGLEDAWEIARKLCLSDDEGFSDDYINAVFPSHSFYSVLKYLTATEVLSKIKEYEEKQQEINVGDEVCFSSKDRGIVISKNDNNVAVLWSDQKVAIYTEENCLKKTGKHFSQIEEMLKMIREEICPIEKCTKSGNG